eukprot:6942519-Pyramimonas_sp.AAC.1
MMMSSALLSSACTPCPLGRRRSASSRSDLVDVMMMPFPEVKPAEGQLSVTAAEFVPNSSCHRPPPVHAVPDLTFCRERPCSGAHADLDCH